MDHKKPITIIAMENHKPLTGGERYIAEIVGYYQKQNRLFRVLQMKDFEPIRKIRIISINRKILKNLSDIPQSSMVLIDFYYHPWVLWAAYNLKRQKNCSIIVLTQWFDFNFIKSRVIRNCKKLLAKLLLKVSDAVIVNSDYFGKVMSNFGADLQKQIIIPPGLDIDKFLCMKRDRKKEENIPVRIAVISNIQQRKGIEDILYGCKMLDTKREFIINIFGDTERFAHYFTEISELLKKLRLEKKVFFHGSIGRSDLVNEIANSDIFLQTSHFEGYGISLVEAMLAALPPITTNTGIAEELVQNGENGFLVTIKNPLEIANALSKLINDVKLRREMGKKAREIALKHALSWEYVCTKFETAIDSFLAKN